MNIKWNEVTWYSKLLSAIFLLLVVPILTFYIGTQYELMKMTSPQKSVSPKVVSGCGESPKGFNRYCNLRLGYSIDYPSSWKLGQEPTDGDGISFETSDSNQIVSISGVWSTDNSFKLSNSNKDSAYAVKPFQFSSGDVGEFSEGSKQGIESLFIQLIKGGIEVDFGTEVPVADYSRIRPAFLQIGKSIRTFTPYTFHD